MAGCLAVTALVALLEQPSADRRGPRAAAAAVSPAVLPLAFEPNAGRGDERIQFLARGPGYSVFLTKDGALTRVGRAQLWTRLAGARRSRPEARERQPGVVNSFTGGRARWRSGIHTYGRVVYPRVYPGIDLVYHGGGGALEYDFEVAPGADPDRIALAIDGARAVRVDAGGDLVLPVDGGTLRQKRPVAYQLRGGRRMRVAAAWRVEGSRVSFELGGYDRRLPLVIDPVLQWGTYYGDASGEDEIDVIAIDAGGNVYGGGYTDGHNFPTSDGAFEPSVDPPDTGDGVVVKLAPDGTRIYASYLGGNEADNIAAIAADASGNAYVVGQTASTGMQVPDTDPGLTSGDAAGYVAKISPDGRNLDYYRYLQGTDGGYEGIVAMKLVGDKLWVTGNTTSATGISTDGVFQPSIGGGQDAFVARLDRDTGAKEIASYLGGTGNEQPLAIDLDPSGNVFVAGDEDGAFIAGSNQGGSDGFLAKGRSDLTAGAGSWARLFGGTGDDTITGLAVTKTATAHTAAGTPYFVGTTTSGSLPGTIGGIHGTGSTSDAFLSRVDGSTGASATYYETEFIGGDAEDSASDLAVDSQNNAYIAGRTYSPGFEPGPTAGTSFSAAPANTSDATGFALKLNWDGGGGLWNTVFATFFGGNDADRVTAIATDDAGSTWIAGESSSGDLPTTPGTAQPDWAGQGDGFFARIAIAPPPPINGPSGATQSKDAEFTWSTPLKEPLMRYSCSFDGAPLASCTSPAKKQGLGDGQHTFTMQSYDNGATPDGPAQVRNWIVDTNAPGGFDLIGPADGAEDNQHPSLSWGEAPDAASGIAKYQVVIDGQVKGEIQPSACSGGTCSGTTASALADGPHTWKVVAVDGVGLTTDSASTRTINIAATPAPTLTIAPNPALVGRAVTFSATSGLDETLATPKYAWDLEGDGKFERDTAGTATTSTSYGTAGAYKTAVRVSTPAGRSATATVELKVNAPAGQGQLGVSIEHGKQFVNTPDVTVTVNAPSGTSSLLFSNDGGFFDAKEFKPAKEVEWKLDSSGPERLPKTIYVRFLTGPIVSQTYQDDIILDETPPTVQSATLAGAASNSAVVRAAAAKRYKLKVKAKDSNSGVGRVQVTANKRKPGKLLKYKRKLTVRLATRPKFVRARDRAGNYSRWHKLR
jgi:hypothetical protein